MYLFGDEAGNFDFSDGWGASRYFVLATVTMHDWQAGDRLQALRRRLAWRGVHLGAVLHASEDPQTVRDEVFGVLARCELRIDATIIAKRDVPVALRDAHALYRYPGTSISRGSPARSLTQATAYSPSPPISAPASAEVRSTSRSTTLCAAQHAVHTAWRSGRT